MRSAGDPFVEGTMRTACMLLDPQNGSYSDIPRPTELWYMVSIVLQPARYSLGVTRCRGGLNTSDGARKEAKPGAPGYPWML